jgi:hypothetical protein
MIVLESFREGHYGIDFSTEEEIEIVIKIVDGYTGLTIYQDRMHLHPGVMYFCGHGGQANSRIYEIWSSELETLLLRTGVKLQSNFSMESVDKYGALKNFKYHNPEDKDPGLPLYEIFLDRIYEKNFQIEEGDTVVDIGGNIGIFSYYAICKGAKKVYCFEPSPLQCSTIKENFKFSNLIIKEAAVAAEDGRISFYVNPESSINSSTIYSENSKEVTCQSINLENYMKTMREPVIDYLKIDCEGGEYAIFESLTEEFLKNSVKKMCVEYHHNHNARILPILAKLASCGFRIEFEHSPEQANDVLGIFYAWKQNN